MKISKEGYTSINSIQKNKLERLLLDLDFSYKKINLSEHEFFYVVNLESIFKNDVIVNVLLVQSEDNKELLIMCPNIYVLKKGDSVLSVLSALNNTNSKLAGGAVTLEDDGTVLYRRIERFDRSDSITKSKILNIFSDIIASIVYTAKEIDNIEK